MNDRPRPITPEGNPGQKAVELISPPLRLAILITLLITAGGIAWAFLARIPIYVNGVAFLMRLGTITGLPALSDGQVYYQFSSSELIRKPLFSRLHRFYENPDAIDEHEISSLTQSLLASKAGGPALAVNSPYPKLIPRGQLLAWVDSPLDRNSLEQSLLNYKAARRNTQAQQAELKRLNSRITTKLTILTRQLSAETAYLNSIQKLLRGGYATRVNLLNQQSRVDTIRAELLTQQQELTANGEKLLEAQTQQLQALDSLRTELGNFVDRGFLFAPGPLYIIDLNAPQASQVRQQDNLLHISAQKLNRLPDQIPGYLSQSDAEQVAPGMEVLVTPMGMDRAQFGGIVGKVVDVSPLPSSLDQIAERIGSLADAQALSTMIADPVRVDLQLLRNPGDREPRHGGFRWSSPGTPPFALSPGSQLTLQITAQRVRPISLLIPSLLRISGASPPTITPQRVRSRGNQNGGAP